MATFKRITSLLALTCLCCLPVFCQTSVDMPMQSDTIDGAVHPELVSDSTAYRLFLAAYAGTDRQHRLVQSVLFTNIGIPEADQPALTEIIDSFGTAFQQILNADAAEIAANPTADHRNFFTQRDVMVTNILLLLKSRLSSTGFNNLNQYVQREKKNMKISADLERSR